jgi:transposase
VIDELNVEPMLRKMIRGGGASRYHPEMFAKVFTYGYMKGTCSCRLLAKALRENVVYMWMSGNQKPGFKTGMRVSAGGAEG